MHFAARGKRMTERPGFRLFLQTPNPNAPVGEHAIQMDAGALASAQPGEPAAHSAPQVLLVFDVLASLPRHG